MKLSRSNEMVIIDIQYGVFPEVTHLNKRFIPGRKRLKLTLDVVSSDGRYERACSDISDRFVELFPSLRKHSCCYSPIPADAQDKETYNPIKKMGRIIDIVHIVEHLIIDLQCYISEMQICSGITCNHWDPRNRFDVFVECVDKRVGVFSSSLTVEMVKNFIAHDELNPKYLKTIKLAKFLHQNPPIAIFPKNISARLGWPLSAVNLALNELMRFQFIRSRE